VDGTPRTNTARLDVDGSLDLTYNPGNRTRGIVRDAIVQPDQKIVVAGSDFMVTRLNSDGSADTSFHNPTDLGGVSAIALQSDAKIVVGGTFSRIQNESRNGLARLNSD